MIVQPQAQNYLSLLDVVRATLDVSKEYIDVNTCVTPYFRLLGTLNARQPSPRDEGSVYLSFKFRFEAITFEAG